VIAGKERSLDGVAGVVVVPGGGGQGQDAPQDPDQDVGRAVAAAQAAQVATVPYPMATPEDLAVTVKKVQALGRRIVAAQADVRDFGRSRPPWTAAWPSSGGWTSRRPTPGFLVSPGWKGWTMPPGRT
jgi:hypothetical protein